MSAIFRMAACAAWRRVLVPRIGNRGHLPDDRPEAVDGGAQDAAVWR
ncbi:hypothetical protein ACFVZR_00490 [Streptomyces sp. NPDC058316]